MNGVFCRVQKRLHTTCCHVQSEQEDLTRVSVSGSWRTTTSWSLGSARSWTASGTWRSTWRSRRPTTERSTRRWTASNRTWSSSARPGTSTWCKRLTEEGSHHIRALTHRAHCLCCCRQVADPEGSSSEETERVARPEERNHGGVSLKLSAAPRWCQAALHVSTAQLHDTKQEV